MIHKEFQKIKYFYSHGHQSFMSYKILQSVGYEFLCHEERFILIIIKKFYEWVGKLKRGGGVEIMECLKYFCWIFEGWVLKGIKRFNYVFKLLTLKINETIFLCIYEQPLLMSTAITMIINTKT